jgi:hypothetical protein
LMRSCLSCVGMMALHCLLYAWAHLSGSSTLQACISC